MVKLDLSGTFKPPYSSFKFIVAITGGRHYQLTVGDELIFFDLLCEITGVSSPRLEDKNLLLIIHGAAQGVDTHIDNLCKLSNIATKAFPVDPTLDGNLQYAPCNRNQRMLDWASNNLLKLSAVISFPGGTGTADCIRRAKAKQIEVYNVNVR